MHDLAIIGAGPAGLAASLYAGRFKLDTVLLEKFSCGGQIVLSSTIENYPGFPGSIPTFQLIEKFKAQVEELGIVIQNREVIQIKPGFEVVAKEGVFKTKTVIIASGAQPKRLGIPGEEKFIGKGISYCGTCDGPLFRSKEIALIGGGDRAIEEAIFLSGYASKIHLVHRRSEFRASGILVDKLENIPNINFLLDNTLEEICGQAYVEKIKVKNIKTGNTQFIGCQGVFIFVGITPNTDFAKNFLDIDEKGFIITDQEMRTSYEGVFAAGDCRNKSLYQVITASSDGAVAADSAHRYLLNKK